MHRYTRLLLASLSATMILAVAVSTATAGRLSLSNQRITTTWASLEFSNTLNGTTVRCPVTLESSFHSATISKTPQALIGHVSVAVVKNTACTDGNVTITQESLPWHLTYEGFSGRLPEVTHIRSLLTGSFFEITAGGIKCNSRTEVRNPGSLLSDLNQITGQVIQTRPDESVRIQLEGGLCNFASGILKGNGRVRLQGTTNLISVKLI